MTTLMEGPHTSPEHRVQSKRASLKVIAGLICVFVLLIATSLWWYHRQVTGNTSGKTVVVTVHQGSNISTVGHDLKRTNVIDSFLAFRIYTKLHAPAPVRAGDYKLHEHMGIRSALKTLTSGPTNIHGTLLLPPGLTIDQIATRVGKLPGMSKDKFLAAATSGQIRSKYEPADVNSLQGLTYPDTYFTDKNETEQEILQRIVKAFDQHADQIGLSNATSLGVTPYQAVTMASLVQMEAQLDSDRSQVAAVLYNRLHMNKPLELDSTVLYARGGDRGAPIKNSDKLINSPYNTYKNTGLPPTPIATVTDASLNAVLHPANVPYLYFVTIDKDGHLAFATTLDQHNANVAIARQRGLL